MCWWLLKIQTRIQTLKDLVFHIKVVFDWVLLHSLNNIIAIHLFPPLKSYLRSFPGHSREENLKKNILTFSVNRYLLIIALTLFDSVRENGLMPIIFRFVSFLHLIRNQNMYYLWVLSLLVLVRVFIHKTRK